MVTPFYYPKSSYEVLSGAFDSLNRWIITGNTTFTGDHMVSNLIPVFDLDSSDGISEARRDKIITTGSGDVSESAPEILVTTGTEAGSTATIRSIERGRAEPRTVGVPGLILRRPSAPTGNEEARWGYFNETDGFYFGEDSYSLFVARKKGGVEVERVYQEDWNGEDKLDGEGPTGYILDPMVPIMYSLNHLPYSGPIEFRVYAPRRDGDTIVKVVHRMAPFTGEPLVDSPKLPVKATVDNGGDASELSLYIGGRFFMLQGTYVPERRSTPETRTDVSVPYGETKPVISFRKKSDRESVTKSVKVLTGSLSSGESGILKLYIDPDLTDANFGPVSEVPDDETAVESDTSSTDISGGTLIQAGIVQGGSGNTVSVDNIQELAQELPEETVVTLAFTNTTSKNATLNAVFTVEEEW